MPKILQMNFQQSTTENQFWVIFIEKYLRHIRHDLYFNPVDDKDVTTIEMNKIAGNSMSESQLSPEQRTEART